MAHLLIIDPDEAEMAPVAQALQKRGLTVTRLDSGAEGLAWAQAHDPACVLLSVELKGLSGYAICNKLKRDPELRRIPLILTSKDATPEIFEEHRRMRTHADAYLAKPLTEEAVWAALEPLVRPAEETEARDPLMSTDALLLLEGSVDTQTHTQVLRLPVDGQGETTELIGAALADLTGPGGAGALAERVTQLEQQMAELIELCREQRAQIAAMHEDMRTRLDDGLARDRQLRDALREVLAQPGAKDH